MKWLTPWKARPCKAGLLFLLGVAFLWPGQSQAQSRWLQNVEFITPVKDEYVTKALLDALFDTMQDEPMALKRAPDDADTLSYYALENELFDTGLDFTSATHLFIGYRLEANQRRFESTITHLFFIYRPQEDEGVDVPIFYLEVDQPAVQDVLENDGTPLINNEAAVMPFREQLVFHKLPESQIVRVSDRVIRDPQQAAAEKQRLLATIRRFVF